jgi:hypothetical protein
VVSQNVNRVVSRFVILVSQNEINIDVPYVCVLSKIYAECFRSVLFILKPCARHEIVLGNIENYSLIVFLTLSARQSIFTLVVRMQYKHTGSVTQIPHNKQKIR